MSDDKRDVRVPRSAIAAVFVNVDPGHDRLVAESAVYDFVRWQRDNPPVPSEKQRMEIIDELGILPKKDGLFLHMIELWICRMYDAPEPEVPKAIKDLHAGLPVDMSYPEAIIEAYNRGLKAAVGSEYHPYAPNPNDLGCAVCGEDQYYHKHRSKP